VLKQIIRHHSYQATSCSQRGKCAISQAAEGLRIWHRNKSR